MKDKKLYFSKQMDKYRKYIQKRKYKSADKLLGKLINRNVDLDDICSDIFSSFFCDPIDFSILKENLKYKIINEEDISSKINFDKPYTFVNYLKTDKTNDVEFLNDVLSIDQFIGTRNKDINKIFNRLIILNENTVFSEYNRRLKENPIWRLKRNTTRIIRYQNILSMAYKMLYIFGVPNSLEIINKMYGEVDLLTLNALLKDINIKNVELKEGKPVLDEYFLNFLFNNKKSDNNVMKRMLKGELETLIINFPDLYNKKDKIKSTIGNKFKTAEVEEILKDTILPPNPVNPMISSLLNKEIINSFRKFSSDDVLDSKEKIKEAEKYYNDNIYSKVYSSIPRVTGENEDFTYEILKVDDPSVLVMGYKTGNCFRLNGIAKNFLDYYSKSSNMRILAIKDKDYGLIGMVPIVRNGSAIVGNGIEISEHYETDGKSKKIFETVKEAYEKIIDVTKDSEEPINLGLITNRNYRVMAWSNREYFGNIMPIYEDEYFINNFSECQYIVQTGSGYYIDGYKSYVPKAIYMDEREEVISNVHGRESIFEVEGKVFGIICKSENGMKIMSERLNGIDLWTVCNNDWFLSYRDNGTLFGTYLEKDPRAKEEYDHYYSLLNSLSDNLKPSIRQPKEKFKSFVKKTDGTML